MTCGACGHVQAAAAAGEVDPLLEAREAFERLRAKAWLERAAALAARLPEHATA